MRILGLDPGSSKSALVYYDPVEARVFEPHVFAEIKENPVISTALRSERLIGADEILVIEYMRARGMPTANEELDTMFWAGRFVESWGGRVCLMPRMEVRMCLCGSSRANDSNIRAALIDRFGGKAKAIGKKASRGPLYQVKADYWQALGLAVTYEEQQKRARPPREEAAR